MKNYSSGKMRSCADDIKAAIGEYSNARTELDNLITTLKSNWQDETNNGYTHKYESELKVVAENVQKTMESFASVLYEAAEAYEKIHIDAKEGMN